MQMSSPRKRNLLLITQCLHQSPNSWICQFPEFTNSSMNEELHGEAMNDSKVLLKSHLNMGGYHKSQNPGALYTTCRQWIVLSNLSKIQQAQVSYCFYRARKGHWWILQFSAFQDIGVCLIPESPELFNLTYLNKDVSIQRNFCTKDPNEVKIGCSVLTDEGGSLNYLCCASLYRKSW